MDPRVLLSCVFAIERIIMDSDDDVQQMADKENVYKVLPLRIGCVCLQNLALGNPRV